MKKSADWRILSTALLLVVSAKPTEAQCTGSGVPQGGNLGCVEELVSTACIGMSSSLTIGTTTCEVLSIEAPATGLPQILVELHITEPPPPLPGRNVRGTVLLGTGGPGDNFFEDQWSGGSTSIGVVHRLVDKGFRVVQRRWVQGWFEENLSTSTIGPFSMKDLANRYATVLQWVETNVHEVGGGEFGEFIAIGQSNGASEVAYALSSWGAEQILDVAVLSAGPTMTHLDVLCGMDPCGGPTPDNVLVDSEGPCDPSDCDILESIGYEASCQSPNAVIDSIDNGTSSVLDYPNTRTHVILGSTDCNTIGSYMGFAFYNAIATTSEKVLEFVPYTPHSVFFTPEGRTAIVNAVLAGAEAASLEREATISFDSWGVMGQMRLDTLELLLSGPPFSVTFLLVDFALASAPTIDTTGWLFLTPDLTFFELVGNLGANGKRIFPIMDPVDTTLSNVPLYFQAAYFDLSGAGTLSNVATLVFDVKNSP